MLALGTLAARAVPRTPALCRLIPALTIAGLALFYGDGLITPAISVLSAVEGLETAAPALEPYVVPIAALVLLGLFLIQSRGTASVGMLFGPVMLVWFATLGLLGLAQIVQNPAVLAALDPRYALGLFGHAGWQAFVALGAIVLAVTGAEALYADMGHFGRAPIRLAWFGLVLPGLVLNYFGQGALVLRDPAALEHPFYHLVPGLGALAADRACHLRHHHRQPGGDLGRVLAHPAGDPARLPAAHDGPAHLGHRDRPGLHPARELAVDGRACCCWCSASAPRATSPPPTASRSPAPWRSTPCWPAWSPPGAGAGDRPRRWSSAFFLLIDLAYFAANALKIPSGGWFPLVVAAAFAYLVVTWRRGRSAVWDKLYAHALPIASFIDRLDPTLIRVRGTAVYMTGNPEVVPMALLHNIEHNQVLHEQVVLMTVRTRDIPYVPEDAADRGRGARRRASSGSP